MTERCTAAALAAWVGLVRAERVLLHAVETELKRAGFPPLACYDVLLELSREKQGRLRAGELQARVLLAQYNLSRLVNRLETDGLAVRERCPRDGRGVVVALTAKGRALRRAMWPAYNRAVARHVAARLSAGEARTLAELLARLGGAA